MSASEPGAGSGAEPTTSVVGGVRASWWNAVVSLVTAVLGSHLPVFVYLVAGPMFIDTLIESSISRLVLVGILGVISLVAQVAMIPWLRAGLGGGVASVPVTGAAVVAGLILWAALSPIGMGVLPLVSSLSLLACASPKIHRRVLFVLAVLVVLLAWLVADRDVIFELPPVVPILVVAYPYLVFASVWAWDVVTRLDRARAVEADLAVTRERLRFASDLHDIQGHSLQVIALKAELAERLLQVKPDDAAIQIAEVRSEAAEALTQTRELVRGYRATSIEDELDNARDVLSEAGFDTSTDVDELPGGSTIRALFGRALREATTNVLRHAEPGPVRIDVGRRTVVGSRRDEWQLRVANSVPDRTERGGGTRDGAGLAGLTERAERLGGRVETEVHDGPGAPRFVLTVSAPATGGSAVTS